MKKSLIITLILIALIAIDAEAQISEAPLIDKGIPVVNILEIQMLFSNLEIVRDWKMLFSLGKGQ